MKLTYNVSDKPETGKMFIFAFQQLLAILAATIAVPQQVGQQVGIEMSQAAALFGAGAGTLIYVLFTKKKSPVFLGSSFAFIAPMIAAFEGAIAVSLGYMGLIVGAVLAGLVYVVLAIIVKLCGVKWISKLMPPIVIGPTVAIIGLSLAGSAVDALTNYSGGPAQNMYTYLCLACGLITLFVTVIASVYGKKMAKMIPFIIGIVAGYIVATIFTVIGENCGVDSMKIIDFGVFKDMSWNPVNTIKQFTVYKAFGDGTAFDGFTVEYFFTVFAAYVPVAFVVFAEHLADHKNLSSIIGHELLEDPGLDHTLLGDGVGSMVGTLFGGCPNTTYGESVGCVAISGNASVITIIVTAIMAMVASFIAPFVTLLASIPNCVMGGVCFALYGFIAVSGLKMVQKVDLGDNRNLFVASVILIAGIGGLQCNIGEHIKITSIACALILGIIVNRILKNGPGPEGETTEEIAEKKSEE